MNNWLSILLAGGVLLGSIDRLLGNRFGLGARFEEAFRLLGPTAISMAGILCLCPILEKFFQTTLAPVLQSIGSDPAILGGILTIDMGGYQLARSLALSPPVGVLAGITVASTFGCTFSFSIPVGCGVLHGQTQTAFLQGILLGLPSLLVSLLVGGLFVGATLSQLLTACLPVLLFCVIFWLLSFQYMPSLVRLLQMFAKILQAFATIGLALGAICLLTGCNFIPEFMPLKDAMNICVEICVTLLGSLPLAELLRRLVSAFGRKHAGRLGSADGLCAALFASVSVVSAISMLPVLSKKEQQIVAACCVCGASVLPHLGFILAVSPQYAGCLLASKIAGLLSAFIFAAFCNHITIKGCP